MRVSTFPTIHGENVVLRLLDRESPGDSVLEIEHAVSGERRRIRLARAIGRMTAEEAQDAQVIFRDPVRRIADESYAPGRDVLEPPYVIDHPAVARTAPMLGKFNHSPHTSPPTEPSWLAQSSDFRIRDLARLTVC